MTESLVGLLCMLVLAFLRLPIALSMGLVGIVGYAYMRDWSWTAAFATVQTKVYETGRNYALSVIPLFILMGNFVTRAGMSQELFKTAYAFIGHLRGGLAMATIVGCAGFGAICGSSIATAATFAKVAYPSMKKFGYSDRLATGAIASGGTLGILVPPSTIMVIYGIMTGTSIGKLFAAGILPGVLGMLLYMAAIRLWTARRPELGAPMPRADRAERRRALLQVWPVLLLFGVVLGGMYAGFFSPTEAAGVGAFGAVLISFAVGRMKRADFFRAVEETATTTGMIFMILIGAGIFNYFISATGLTDSLIQAVKDTGLSPWTIMLLLMVMYFILGALMDELAMMLLTVGPVFKLIVALGFDPIWFGVMFVTVCEIGMILPPVGINLFVIQSIAGIPLGTVVRGIFPFVAADTLRLAIIALVPALATWLPGRMAG